jgi:calcineurin-like phosphoesterase family protein
MNEALIWRWNSRVTPEDTVYVLGDVCMGKIDTSLALISRLQGEKILLAGNHDRCWNGHGHKSSDWISRYRDAGFLCVYSGSTASMRICLSLEPYHDARISHFPYRSDLRAVEPYARHREHHPLDMGDWLLHGHVHGLWRQRGRMINVGVDAWNGYPISEGVILHMMRDGEADIPAAPWKTPHADARDFARSVR